MDTGRLFGVLPYPSSSMDRFQHTYTWRKFKDCTQRLGRRAFLVLAGSGVGGWHLCTQGRARLEIAYPPLRSRASIGRNRVHHGLPGAQ